MKTEKLERLKSAATEALGRYINGCDAASAQAAVAMVQVVAALDGMEPDDAQPDPRCTLCDLGAPPHRWHGLSAKFEPHGMANVPSGQAMLLDGPAPTPKQEAYFRRETLEVAAQYLESLKLTGAHECAEVVRGLKAKKQNDECAGCQICELQAQVTHQQEANKRYAWVEALMRQQARIESEM